ncbi:HNH endonuclease signature motif containing protein [Bacillus sp. JK62]
MQGRRTSDTVVDHIVPHKGGMNLFWDSSKWLPLCASCHGR